MERPIVLTVAGVMQSVDVRGTDSRIEARDPGFGTRFGPEDLEGDPDATREHVRLHQGRPGDLADLAVERHHDHRLRVRLRHQREPVSHRRHELHLPVQRHRASRAGHRLHSGNAGPVRRRVRRVRQRPGRRDQRRHQAGKRAVSLRRVVLRADRRPDQPAGAAADPTRPGSDKADTSAPGIATSRRTSAVLPFAIGCGSSADTSICATTTASPAPTRHSREPTSRTRSSRSSRGGSLRAGSWCKAFTTSSGSTPNSPTFAKPFEATLRLHASVPAITFGHLTHTSSANTVWDVRVGRFVYARRGRPEHRQSDDAEPVRPRDGCLQRRAAARSAG